MVVIPDEELGKGVLEQTSYGVRFHIISGKMDSVSGIKYELMDEYGRTEYVSALEIGHEYDQKKKYMFFNEDTVQVITERKEG